MILNHGDILTGKYGMIISFTSDTTAPVPMLMAAGHYNYHDTSEIVRCLCELDNREHILLACDI